MRHVILYRPFFICIFLFLLFNQTFGQVKSIVEQEFYQIKFIPTERLNPDSRTFAKYKNIDSSYNKILKLGTTAIPFLIPKMTDTTLTKILNPCDNDEPIHLGDLAWFIITDIEKIPLFQVTKNQWCVWGVCEHFPLGFFTSLNFYRNKYAKGYKNYFYSKERRKIITKEVSLN